jgi:hypothetical protein
MTHTQNPWETRNANYDIFRVRHSPVCENEECPICCARAYATCGDIVFGNWIVVIKFRRFKKHIAIILVIAMDNEPIAHNVATTYSFLRIATFDWFRVRGIGRLSMSKLVGHIGDVILLTCVLICVAIVQQPDRLDFYRSFFACD